MGMFLILFVTLVLGILGAVYAPEIRLWLNHTGKAWQSRWDRVNDELAAEMSKEDEKEETNTDDSSEK